MTDLQGAYSGVQNPASLLMALEAQHPDELQNTSLEPASRSLLLSWLRGDEPAAGRRGELFLEKGLHSIESRLWVGIFPGRYSP